MTSNGDKKGLRRPPYAFTEQGVAMLSGILNSDVAIDTNIMIMRAFVAVRNLLSIPEPADKIAQIEKEIVAIKEEMNLILADQNDINEMAQAQLDAISVVLAELQTNGNNAPIRRIGYSTEKK
ncbi:MAG: ORF6N domain-containing protein [Bacteroidales bacterium]|nr:ORF6N domain-containing protein [Bacteroidales bacterium]